jgi:hypothetical protein
MNQSKPQYLSATLLIFAVCCDQWWTRTTEVSIRRRANTKYTQQLFLGWGTSKTSGTCFEIHRTLSHKCADDQRTQADRVVTRGISDYVDNNDPAVTTVCSRWKTETNSSSINLVAQGSGSV